MAYQAENKLTISLKRPQDKNVTSLYKTPNYSGNKLSLDFQDIEVRLGSGS
ncbi:HofQ [Acinetobacter baumannii]|nr:HofQ [Acinetobacter baumannii]